MSTILWANNATTTISGSVTNIATTVALTPGAGALFPAPGAGQYFVATFVDAATGLLNEIVHVTDVTGDVATIVRAQEGTTALNWSAGDLFSNLVTAGTLESFSQTTGSAYAVDTGAANAYIATIAGIGAYVEGAALLIKMTHTNTGASTFNLNGLGAKAIQTGGAALAANAIIAGCIYTLVYDGVEMQLLEGNALGAGGGGGGGSLLIVNNLSDVANVATARLNLLVPTRTGGDASGTWGINISGTAAIATVAEGVDPANTYHGVDFIATSDITLKDRGENLLDVLDNVGEAETFYFRWNEKARELGIDDDSLHIGVSAQDLQRINVALATMGENGVLGVNVSACIAYLFACVNALNAKVA